MKFAPDTIFCEVLLNKLTNVGQFEIGQKIYGIKTDLALGIEKNYFRVIDVDPLHEDFDVGEYQEAKIAGTNPQQAYNPTPKRHEIELNDKTREINDLARTIVRHMKLQKNFPFFYRPRLNRVVEVKKQLDKKNEIEYNMIIEVNPYRLISVLQHNLDFVRFDPKRPFEPIKEDIKETKARLLMHTDVFLNALPKLDRVIGYNMAYSMQGTLHVTHTGYNEDSEIYVTEGAPELSTMDVSKAKDLLLEVFEEFCFKEESDKVIALAYLLTPFARGFYSKSNTNNPVFMIKANRERAGKDYLAGCVGIIYEGEAINFAPISTGERTDNDELRKRVMSVLMAGGRRYHSQNNKGNINNAFFEMVTTSPVIKERLLGRNDIVELDNEIDFSLSCNIGITYTPDLKNRSRSINLFYAEENANARQFKKADLHGWIRDKRKQLLGAIFTLYKTWFEAGAPNPRCVFSSFPEWARVVGGVMEYHGLGDPTIEQEDDAVGGDYETVEMKKLYEICHEKQQGFYRITDIINVIKDEDVFSSWDFSTKSAQTRIGLVVRKYVGRVLSSIKLVNRTPNQPRASRIEYVFEKIIILPKNEQKNDKILECNTKIHLSTSISTEIEQKKVYTPEYTFQNTEYGGTNQYTKADTNEPKDRKNLATLATFGNVTYPVSNFEDKTYIRLQTLPKDTKVTTNFVTQTPNFENFGGSVSDGTQKNLQNVFAGLLKTGTPQDAPKNAVLIEKLIEELGEEIVLFYFENGTLMKINPKYCMIT